jgi:hypothetical protein
MGVRVARWLDADGEAHVLCDFNTVPGQGTGSVDDGGATFDPTRGSRGTVWTVGSGTSRLVGIDVASGVATPRGESDNHIPSGGALAYVPGLDVLAYFGGSIFRIMRLDTDASTTVSPSLSGSYSPGFQWLTFDGAAVDWCAERGAFLLWNNLTARSEISTLSPSDPRDPSAPWVRGVLRVDADNAVIPPLLGSNGATPFGRGRYSRSLGGFLLLGGTTMRPHFFAVG